MSFGYTTTPVAELGADAVFDSFAALEEWIADPHRSVALNG